MKVLESLPIPLIYATIFGLSALSKLKAPEVPQWFAQQFAGTVLNAFPGALGLSFYSIGVLEALATVIFLVAIIKRALLRPAFLLSCFIFVILNFGTRLSGDFNTAAQVFLYFAVTWFLFLKAV